MNIKIKKGTLLHAKLENGAIIHGIIEKVYDNSFMIDLGGDDKATNKDQGSGRFNDRSPACCSPQYPVPFKLKVDKQILKDSKEFVPNPYMGNNNWMNAGCTCMKKVNASKLAKRGGNA